MYSNLQWRHSRTCSWYVWVAGPTTESSSWRANTTRTSPSIDWVTLGVDGDVYTGRRIATSVLPAPVEGGLPVANLGAVYSWEFPETDRDALLQDLIASGWHKIAEWPLPPDV